jgi:hypothetical protein
MDAVADDIDSCQRCAVWDNSVLNDYSVAKCHAHPLKRTWPASWLKSGSPDDELTVQRMNLLAWSAPFCCLWRRSLASPSSFGLSPLGVKLAGIGGPVDMKEGHAHREFLVSDLWSALVGDCEPYVWVEMESWVRLQANELDSTGMLAAVRIWCVLITHIGVDPKNVRTGFRAIVSAIVQYDLAVKRSRGPHPDRGRLGSRHRRRGAKITREDAIVGVLRLMEVHSSALRRFWGIDHFAFTERWFPVCDGEQLVQPCADSKICRKKCFDYDRTCGTSTLDCEPYGMPTSLPRKRPTQSFPYAQDSEDDLSEYNDAVW